MTGKIKLRKNHTNEFYYGIGYIMGRKRDGIISKHRGDTNGFGVLLPSTIYKEKVFYTIGLPLEYKVQWNMLGLGIDSNLNFYLPYLGFKLYLKL